jgi:SecY interacting protein Syd
MLTPNGHFSCTPDPQWQSACELGDTGDWRPADQLPPVSFQGLSNALEVPIHADIQTYYGSFWAGSIEAESEEGHVSLIQLWNPDDFDRLIQNLIGHALMKRRSKQPFTVFFANTEADSELFLSIDNDTGVILLEEPGKAPIRQVEDNLGTFLNRLTPVLQPPGIY